jgi:hypothetical protein
MLKSIFIGQGIRQFGLEISNCDVISVVGLNVINKFNVCFLWNVRCYLVEMNSINNYLLFDGFIVNVF